MTVSVGIVGPLPPPFGGMANQANQLLQLLKLENDIEVCFLQNNPPYKPEFLAHIKGVRAVFRLAKFIFQVISLCRKVDVIHVFSNSGWSWQLFSAPVLWIAPIFSTPVIINYRGGEAGSYFKESINTVKPSMDKASKVIVPSGYLKKTFQDFNLDSEIIPNIINLDRFDRGRTLFNQDRPHLVITRNLEKIYGIETAIKAIAHIHASFPALKLSIAGSGPQREELENLVEQLGLEQTVFFTGKLTPEEVAVLYSEADIMLNPTTVDNMPNSVLEAMASGVAIITTDVGGIPYIVEDNQTALFFSVGNDKQLAELITKLIKDKGLQMKLQKNAEKEVRQYAWPEVKQQWIQLYKSFKK